MRHQTKEGSTSIFEAYLKDERGNPVTTVSDATLTYKNSKTQEIINGRDDQNILNDNNVTIDPVTGKITWLMQPADNVVTYKEDNPEQVLNNINIATFTFRWSAGKLIEKVEIEVKRMVY